MILYKSLFTGMLCLLLSVQLSAQNLQQRVSLSYKNVSLQAALEDLQSRYGLQFSYINNDLPGDATIRLQLNNVALQEALDHLLAPTKLGYAAHSGRIIISKTLPKRAVEAPAPQQEQQPESGPVKGPKQPAQPAPDSEPANLEAEEKPESGAGEGLPQITPQPLEQVEQSGQEDMLNQKSPSPSLYATVERAVFSKIETEEEAEIKPLHVGLIYPISNHGTQAGMYVNRVSLHLLVGYAAGLEGVEVSGVGNIENDYVQGAQLAGLFNVVKRDVRGMQASGFVNLTGGGMRGAQFAGFANLSRESLQGAQFAGFGNLASQTDGAQFAGYVNVSGKVDGGQFSGFGNLASQVQGVQLAGFGNLADSVSRGGQYAGFGNIARRVTGAQLSGFGNLTKSIKGVQAAGFGNIAGQVDGLQVSGFLNIAGHVKGVQLGVINIADSVDGVPIGFLSLVRKGYRSAELWTGEDFNANVAFKIGVERFYNIFAFGAQLEGPNRWGMGYGVGSLWRLNNRLHLNTDLLSFNIFENSLREGFPQEQELNLLNKFRLLGGWQFARHFSVFAGPTFNVLVSRHQNEDGSIGSQLVEKTFYNETSTGGTNVKMWVGFNAGLRF